MKNLPVCLAVFHSRYSSWLSFKALSQWTDAIGKRIRIDLPEIKKKIWILDDVYAGRGHFNYTVVLLHPNTREKTNVQFSAFELAVRHGHDEPRLLE